MKELHMTLTAKGQTPHELANEFIFAMRDTPSGSKDMDIFFDALVAKEHMPSSPKVLESIESVAGSPLNARTLGLFTKTGIEVTDTLLSWVCLQSNGIPAYIDTMLGLLAVHFYAQNPKGTKMTLGWVGETIGKGKLVGFRQLLPWHLAAMNTENKNIFEDLPPEEMFTFKATQLQ